VNDGFQGFEKSARVPLVLEPVANLLPVRVVPHQIRGPELGEMAAHRLNDRPAILASLLGVNGPPLSKNNTS
jgi:hypothetical protein